MTREADWRAPGGLPAPPRPLATALTILAQFDSERAVLDQADITRLTGCSSSVAQQCLATLAELGYLTEAPNATYRLAGGESGRTGAGHDEDGTLDTTA
ncbi:MAG TPA: helix-turn-helix domain-containing protein [Solirubrobacteraceae bacterium]|jgi:hypothetical protein|nr:helix-turn-helix domain-containing protein [Solirubrobacteraceae bacterium]